ncbi:DLA class I histocompatibility antigen, A9/A9 alpha chain-like isoform X2 [Epinephelus lanceolatus]
MKKLFLMLFLCQFSSAVKHTLRYALTTSSREQDFMFVGIAVVDGIVAVNCDSINKKVEPKQDWMKKAYEDNPRILERHTQQCYYPNFFKTTIHDLKQRFNQSGEPSVFLLQKTPSSPVSCHAIGFFPDRAMMFWRKDGEEIHEDVEHGEILPNHDGTFQMSVDLDLSSVTREDWWRYDCVFHLSGVNDNIVTRLDEAVIRTNRERPSNMTVPIIAAMVALAVFLVAAFGFMAYKKKKAKGPPSPPDNAPEVSEKLNPAN